MKNINNLLTLLTTLLLLAACEKEGDKFFLSTPEGNELIVSTDAIILKEEAAKLYAMSLAWTEQTLQINDSRYEPTTGIETTVQASLTEDFSGNIQESVESGLSKSYTVAALNVVAYRLGITEIKATPIYFRLAARNGSNTDPIYSNIVKVIVTPYSIDMRYATLVPGGDNPIAETTVYSANADGIYQGFVAAKSWGSFFLQESDETLWHTVENSPFMLTTSGSWSQWLPKYAGCYFLNFNTTQKLWTALQIPTLEINGIDGLTMKYSQEDNQWKGVFNGKEGNSYSIQLKGTGWLFTTNSVEGGTINDDKYKETPFVFGGTADQLTFSTGENVTAGNITVNVPMTGECTLVIDLNNPEAWTVSVTEKEEEPEPEPEEGEYLYLPGIGPAVNGQWAYDHKITIYDKDAQKYAGVVNVASEWGDYAMCLANYWDESKLYTLATDDNTSTAESGSLINGKGNNLTAPDDGLYLFEVSLEGLKYSVKAVTGIYCYLGISGNNDLTPLQSTDTEGLYTGTITLDQDSEYGVKFVINNDWTGSYGGYDGKLYYNANKGIYPVTTGTYDISVDLINGTYTIQSIN